MQPRQQKRIQPDKIALSISSSEEAALSISFYRQFVSSLLIESSEGPTTTFELDKGKFESQNDCSMTSFRQKFRYFMIELTKIDSLYHISSLQMLWDVSFIVGLHS